VADSQASAELPGPALDGASAPVPDWEPGVLAALYNAAFSSPGSERIGVLVGAPSATSAPSRISAMIPASTAEPPGRAQLDHAAWAYIHSTMARYYGGLDIVGWWVSRPGPDTQLDPVDLEAARVSFARPTQFGFVFDSEHRRVAFYGWRGGGYCRLHEELVPRRLARPHERIAGAGKAAATAFALGVFGGVAGWLLTGRPGLITMSGGGLL
jgi:hypothetical protein